MQPGLVDDNSGKVDRKVDLVETSKHTNLT